jgi:hypothetical protein
VSGQLHSLAAKPQRTSPPPPVVIGEEQLYDRRAGLDDMEKWTILDLYQDSNYDPSVVQPVSSRYTEYVTSDS